MDCPNCGETLPADARKCPNCGALIVFTAQVTAAARGVAAGGDINAPVFTGDINAPVTISYTQLAPIPDPPPPDRPPLVSEFIGREVELEYYTQKLAAAHLAVITGIAGVGKTALAAVLARRAADLEQVFWHTFHPDEGIDAILWRLAAFLAANGQPDPWRTLYRARNLTREETLRYLIQAVRGRGYLLCLDDFQHVDDDPLIEALVGELRSAVQAGEITLILTSRRMPAFVQETRFEPLQGIGLEDIAHLAQRRGLELTPAQLESLHSATEGNAELLVLALQALQTGRSPDRLVENLSDAQDIERFLLDEVDRGLTSQERDLLAAAAALLGYPATRESLEYLLDAGVRRPLADLLRSNLLQASEGRYGAQYSLHTILQSFYYDTLGPSQKRDIHLRAAAFYEKEQPDPLRAVLYYERGSEPAKAVALATGGLEEIINQGQARLLARLLDRIPVAALDEVTAAQATLALGELFAFLGENGRASAAFQAAWKALSSLPSEPAVRRLRLRTCLSLAAFLEFEDPQAALEWLQYGLDTAGEAAQAEPGEPDLARQHAALLLRLGSVQFQLGNYQAATAALQDGLARLPAGELSSLAAIGQRCLGEVAYSLGDVEQAIHYVQQGLEISRKLGDTFETVNALIDLGILRHTSNDWPGGIAAFDDALALARNLGSRKQQATLELNLGQALTYLSQDEDALSHLQESLRLASDSNLLMVRALALYALADLHIRRAEWPASEDYLEQAEACAREIDFRPALISIHYARAKVQIGLGHPQDAAADANEALRLAGELGENLEEAVARRVQAQVNIALGRVDQAVEALELSLEQLESLDRYEAALTREALGCVLQASRPQEAREQLLQARDALQALKAQRDLQRVEERLESAV
ncbi:MAG TPA: AAA family ATPase [Anaerolineales bacterium]